MIGRTQKTWERMRRRGDREWYFAYLRSHHWRQLRKRRLAKARWRCERCGRVDPHHDARRGTRLHVHHKNYARLSNERMSDLMALCRACHARQHRVIG